MGNEQPMPKRHVSFESRSMNPDRSFDPRYSYDLAPNMRSREFNMGQRFQERTQVRTNFPNEQWNYQPGGGSTRTVTRQEWQGGGGGYDGRRQPPDYGGGYEEYDWSSTRGQRPYTQRTTYVSNSRGGRPADDSWHQQPTTTGYYSQTTPRQSTSVTRSYETDGNYPGGGGYPRGRAFNTRDYDDPWYHYKPVVNRRPDWALVGRHVLARPASAGRQVKTVEQDFRRLRDFDTFSDPASYGGPGGVRQTFNPRFPRAQQAISNYQNHWTDDFEAGIRRPTQSSYYKTYSVNSYR